MHKLTTALAIGIVALFVIIGLGIAERLDPQTVTLVTLSTVALVVGMLAAALIAGVLAHTITRDRSNYHSGPLNDYHDRPLELSRLTTAQLPPRGTYPPAPYQVRRVNVPVLYHNAQPATILTTSVQHDDGTHEERACNIRTLRVATDILADGEPPTRQSFNKRGIMASTEIGACVAYLRAHGWVQPGEKGSPARWIDGASAEQLAGWLDMWAQ